MTTQRMAKTPFHAAYTLLHDAIVKKGFITLSGEVSLPFNWDDNAEIISLKYQTNTKQMEVKCLLMSDSMVVSMLHNNELKTLDISISNYIEDFDEAKLTYSAKNLLNFERKVYDYLIYPLFADLKPPSPTPPAAERPRTDPPQRPDPLRDDRFQPRRGRPRVDPVDPFGVGAGDLDPFGGGAGMIMDPMRNRGGFRQIWPPPPPGARFDPIGPGGRGPDNDELMPPDRHRMFDQDDMFM